MNHTTATAHRRKDGAWLVRCWCGKHSGWHALLSTCVARQIDHGHAEAEDVAA